MEQILLTPEDWESINKKAGVDVLDIVVDLDNRYTPGQQAELIVERCNLTAQAQLKKVVEFIGGVFSEQKWQALLKEVEES